MQDSLSQINTPTAHRALDVLMRVAEADGLDTDLDAPLYESGILDSLKTVELIVAFAEEFHIQISPAEFERDKWATPRKIVDDILARIGE